LRSAPQTRESRAINSGEIALFIDPFSHHFEQDRLFAPDEIVQLNGHDIAGPWVHLRRWFGARSIPVHTADRLLAGEARATRNVFISFGLRKRCRAVARRPDVILSAFFAFESPVVEPRLYSSLSRMERYFKRLFTFTDSDSLGPFLRGPIRSEEFRVPSRVDSAHEDLWQNRNRKFLVMINHNKVPAVNWQELYRERVRAVAFFARMGEIDLYGRGWNDPPFQMGIGWMPGTAQRLMRAAQRQWEHLRPSPLLAAARRVYRGAVPAKLETLSRYTFSLCFENVILNGWVTEKIFDCMAVGTIPIYWGAPDIEKYVPADCFIDMRRFGNYEHLHSYLHGLTDAEIQVFREKGRTYLASERYRPFTKQAFTLLVARLVAEDTGVVL
jgi:alpha(1,3/1,4) fucosyltransferase